MRSYTYTYKDSHRMYWRIELKETNDSYHGDVVWEYYVYRNMAEFSENNLFYGNTFVGQIDEQPTLNDVLSNLQSSLCGHFLGFAVHGKEISRAY